MTSADRYATHDQLQQRLDPAGSQTWSATDDAIHEAIIDAVSRAIDGVCGQFFWKSSAAAARYFTAEWPDLLVVPPIASTTGLVVKTDETATGVYGRTWAATDYVLWPFNAASDVPARPWYEIRVDERSTSSGYVFPTGQKGVEVTALWGWPAVPDPVREVCLLESQRLIQQSASPSGVVASAELGQWLVQPKMHPTSMLLLGAFKRTRIEVGRVA